MRSSALVTLVGLLAMSTLPVSGQNATNSSNATNSTPPSPPNPPPSPPSPPPPPPPGYGPQLSVPEYRAFRGMSFPAVPNIDRLETSVILKVQLD